MKDDREFGVAKDAEEEEAPKEVPKEAPVEAPAKTKTEKVEWVRDEKTHKIVRK